MNVDSKINQIHNIRLFPKGNGASAYRLTGIAQRCDWVIMTDLDDKSACLLGDTDRPPRTVFLSLRSYSHAITYFCQQVLPKIRNRFVLITGSEDFTVPNQVDQRLGEFDAAEREQISLLLQDHRLIHWFAENRDEDLPKISTLPTGYVFEEESDALSYLAPETVAPRLKFRPLRVLCAHRVRENRQWDVRKNLFELCNTAFPYLSTVITEEIPESEFIQQIHRHAFVLCAQGGGLDPSPKVWHSIANGSIPIIKSSTLDDAYSQLPIAFVDDWTEDCLSMEILRGWVHRLGPYYDDERLRGETLHKLSLDYWWERVSEKLQ